jgi:hypothetical protein
MPYFFTPNPLDSFPYGIFFLSYRVCFLNHKCKILGIQFLFLLFHELFCFQEIIPAFLSQPQVIFLPKLDTE